MLPRTPISTLFPYTTLFRSFVWVGVLGSFATLMLGGFPHGDGVGLVIGAVLATVGCDVGSFVAGHYFGSRPLMPEVDRKSTRLNSSHLGISYAVFCLKKKNP